MIEAYEADYATLKAQFDNECRCTEAYAKLVEEYRAERDKWRRSATLYLDAAVDVMRDERERCAGIADAWRASGVKTGDSMATLVFEMIAKEIRNV